jgi:hypothetical protein
MLMEVMLADPATQKVLPFRLVLDSFTMETHRFTVLFLKFDAERRMVGSYLSLYNSIVCLGSFRQLEKAVEAQLTIM